jgi:hypothetical protein
MKWRKTPKKQPKPGYYFFQTAFEIGLVQITEFGFEMTGENFMSENTDWADWEWVRENTKYIAGPIKLPTF